jgi:hypothetical protein
MVRPPLRRFCLDSHIPDGSDGDPLPAGQLETLGLVRSWAELRDLWFPCCALLPSPRGEGCRDICLVALVWSHLRFVPLRFEHLVDLAIFCPLTKNARFGDCEIIVGPPHRFVVDGLQPRLRLVSFVSFRRRVALLSPQGGARWLDIEAPGYLNPMSDPPSRRLRKVEDIKVFRQHLALASPYRRRLQFSLSSKLQPLCPSKYT